jgi:uncharacterized protein (TIGR04222 family)
VNPFDLRGPEFLVFYFALGLATLGIVWFLRRTNESDSTVSPVLNDYLEIAYLRGGANEALRVATMNLINRGFIDVKTDDRLHTLDPKAHVLVSKESERGILEKFRVAQAATQIFSDRSLRRTVAEECLPALARMGLVPDRPRQAMRAVLLFVGASILTAVAGIKILLALSRGRPNIGLLIIAAAVFCVLLYKATTPLCTPAGNALLADLRTLFAGLRERGGSLMQGVDTQDFALLMAVFGMSALPPAFSFDRLFPQAAKTSSACGSGCGTSSGGGSSCGGGGCGGGCGGCGS